jgi:hypothetical protein
MVALVVLIIGLTVTTCRTGFEILIGSDPNSSRPPNDAMGDIDGDGYKNVEEWSHYLYSWQPPKLLKR